MRIVGKEEGKGDRIQTLTIVLSPVVTTLIFSKVSEKNKIKVDLPARDIQLQLSKSPDMNSCQYFGMCPSSKFWKFYLLR